MQKSFATQPKLFVSATDLNHPMLCSFDDTEVLLDWSNIEKLLSSIYASKTGRPSYPLLTLFLALLLGTWYRLSDAQLAQCLYRDLLLRMFCHLDFGGDVPESSTLGRFRTRLVEHHLWDKLLAEINRQLEVKNIIMSEGRINIIDATPIEATQSVKYMDVPFFFLFWVSLSFSFFYFLIPQILIANVQLCGWQK